MKSFLFLISANFLLVTSRVFSSQEDKWIRSFAEPKRTLFAPSQVLFCWYYEVLFLIISTFKEIYSDYFPYRSFFSDKRNFVFEDKNDFGSLLLVWIQRKEFFLSVILDKFSQAFHLVSQKYASTWLCAHAAPLKFTVTELTLPGHLYVFVFQLEELKPNLITKVHATNAARLFFFLLENCQLTLGDALVIAKASLFNRSRRPNIMFFLIAKFVDNGKRLLRLSEISSQR